MTHRSCELFGKFHIITLCHSMIPVACQRMITSIHHDAAAWLFLTSAIWACSVPACVSCGLSLGRQRLSMDRTHVFRLQKTSMLSFVHLSSESQTLHRLNATPTNLYHGFTSWLMWPPPKCVVNTCYRYRRREHKITLQNQHSEPQQDFDTNCFSQHANMLLTC